MKAELWEIVAKAEKVIDSCKTKAQYRVARTYCDRVADIMGLNIFIGCGLYDKIDDKLLEIWNKPITPRLGI